jgi:hypothetical protein
MRAALVAKAVRAALRPGAAGRRAFEQHLRDAGLEATAEPLERVGLALVSAAAPFADLHPWLFVGRGRGAVLVDVLVRDLAERLPGDDDPHRTARVEFVAGTGAVALRAGLGALSDHPGLEADADTLRGLVESLVAPLVAEFEDAGAHRPAWIALRDQLFGPVVRAAFWTVLSHPTPCPAGRLAAGRAAAPIVQAILIEADAAVPWDAARGEGLVRIARAAFELAARRPELFATGELGDEGVLALELVSGVSAALRAASALFPKDTAAALAALAVEVVGEHAPDDPESDEPWTLVVGEALESFFGGMEDGTEGDPAAAARLLAESAAGGLARALFAQAAHTPALVAGGEGRALVAVLARAMAGKEGARLTPGAWCEVASLAAREAASHPGRLFDPAAGDPADHPAARRIARALAAAADAEAKRDPADGDAPSVQMLRDSIAAALVGVAGESAC